MPSGSMNVCIYKSQAVHLICALCYIKIKNLIKFSIFNSNKNIKYLVINLVIGVQALFREMVKVYWKILKKI